MQECWLFLDLLWKTCDGATTWSRAWQHYSVPWCIDSRVQTFERCNPYHITESLHLAPRPVKLCTSRKYFTRCFFCCHCCCCACVRSFPAYTDKRDKPSKSKPGVSEQPAFTFLRCQLAFGGVLSRFAWTHAPVRSYPSSYQANNCAPAQLRRGDRNLDLNRFGRAYSSHCHTKRNLQPSDQQQRSLGQAFHSTSSISRSLATLNSEFPSTCPQSPTGTPYPPKQTKLEPPPLL